MRARDLETSNHIARKIRSYLRENNGYHSVSDIMGGIGMKSEFRSTVERVLYIMHTRGQSCRTMINGGEWGYSYA